MEISSIRIDINDNLVNYLSNEEGVSIMGIPFYFILKNVGLTTLNLEIFI